MSSEVVVARGKGSPEGSDLLGDDVVLLPGEAADDAADPADDLQVVVDDEDDLEVYDADAARATAVPVRRIEPVTGPEPQDTVAGRRRWLLIGGGAVAVALIGAALSLPDGPSGAPVTASANSSSGGVTAPSGLPSSALPATGQPSSAGASAGGSAAGVPAGVVVDTHAGGSAVGGAAGSGAAGSGTSGAAGASGAAGSALGASPAGPNAAASAVSGSSGVALGGVAAGGTTTAEDTAAGVVSRVVPDAGDGHLAVVPGAVPAVRNAPVWRVRVEVEGGIGADGTAFADFVMRTLNDPRGWGHDGSRTFSRTDATADIRVVLASPSVAASMCNGLVGPGEVSCGGADKVVLTMQQWAQGADSYGEDRGAFRQYLLNHEIGHVLGRPHVQCTPGKAAPVMMQQAKGLFGCVRNSWPYPA